jgi:serine carboxypeptidase-like clade 1
VNNSGALIRNPYAWTKIANLLILENPAGVGYSYCTNNGQPSTNCSNTDIKTAAAARSAVAHFFGSKFPSLAKNDFVITGESYAGVYVPTLAKEIVVNAPQVNLVAIAVGDPCTDNTAQRDSMDMLW